MEDSMWGDIYPSLTWQLPLNTSWTQNIITSVWRAFGNSSQSVLMRPKPGTAQTIHLSSIQIITISSSGRSRVHLHAAGCRSRRPICPLERFLIYVSCCCQRCLHTLLFRRSDGEWALELKEQSIICKALLWQHTQTAVRLRGGKLPAQSGFTQTHTADTCILINPSSVGLM